MVCERFQQCVSIEKEWDRVFGEFYCIAANPAYTNKLYEIIQQLAIKLNSTSHASKLNPIDKNYLIILNSISSSIGQCLPRAGMSSGVDRSYRSWSVLGELIKHKKNRSNKVLLCQIALRKLMREINSVIKKAESLKANSNVSESQKLQLSQAIAQLTTAREALNQFDQGKVHDIDPDYRQPFRAKLKQIEYYRFGSVKANSDLVEEIDGELQQNPAKQELLKEIYNRFELLKKLKKQVLSSDLSNDLVRACSGEVASSAQKGMKEERKVKILDGKRLSPSCLLKEQFDGIKGGQLKNDYSKGILYEKYNQMMQLLNEISKLFRMEHQIDLISEDMSLDQLTAFNDKMIIKVKDIELASGKLLGRVSRKVTIRGMFADITTQASPVDPAAAVASGIFSPKPREG